MSIVECLYAYIYSIAVVLRNFIFIIGGSRRVHVFLVVFTERLYQMDVKGEVRGLVTIRRSDLTSRTPALYWTLEHDAVGIPVPFQCTVFSWMCVCSSGKNSGWRSSNLKSEGYWIWFFFVWVSFNTFDAEVQTGWARSWSADIERLPGAVLSTKMKSELPTQFAARDEPAAIVLIENDNAFRQSKTIFTFKLPWKVFLIVYRHGRMGGWFYF